MKTHKVLVGIDLVYEVEFKAELIGALDSNPADNAGTDYKLFQLNEAEDNLVVYSHHWSKWENAIPRGDLEPVSRTDLAPLGRFDALGAVSGFARSLTIGEWLDREGADDDR